MVYFNGSEGFQIFFVGGVQLFIGGPIATSYRNLYNF